MNFRYYVLLYVRNIFVGAWRKRSMSTDEYTS